MQEKFIAWLEANKPKSARHYTSGYNTINNILKENGLSLIETWNPQNYHDNYERIISIEEFKNLNSTGNNILTATLSNFKKFIFNMTSTYTIPPQIPFPEFKWRWAVTTPSESINSEDILFGVLKILVKHNGKRHATQEFKDDLLKLQNDTNSTIDLAKIDRDLNKNIIENSGQYWKALGLLNSTNDGTISVTEIGLGIINGSVSKEDYIKYLYDNFNLPNQNIESEAVIRTYTNANIRVSPIKIIFQVLYSITKSIQSPSEWYLTPDELKDIIVPLSIYPELDYESYVEYIFSYRKDKSLFSAWPNVTPGDNDFRMLKEYLIFLSNFGYIDLVELKDKSKRYYINELTLNIINGNLSQTNYKQIKPVSTNQISFDSKTFEIHTKEAGLIFSPQLIQRFIASLCTKPFVICSGLSGSGKTKLAQAFVLWITADKSQYAIIPVGADWTNREPLLGYPNGLDPKSYVTPDSGALKLILEASKVENQSRPYFMILDEMNLSHVERYFADFLSIMESGDSIKLYSGADRVDSDGSKIEKEIIWPKNLFIIGTVNIDETTYMFSPKVLDRANVIEFRISDTEMKFYFDNRKALKMEELFLNKDKNSGGAGQNMGEDFYSLSQDKSVIKIPEAQGDNNVLNKFFAELQIVGSEFGYRSASEIELLITKLGNDRFIDEDGKPIENKTKIDIAIMQKLLPKLHGSRKKLVDPLETLAGFCLERIIESQPDEQNKTKNLYQQFISEKRDIVKWNIIYPISLEKIERMRKNVIENGFTSYAEA
jgi:5-methylcytosine-specific restriction protein B